MLAEMFFALVVAEDPQGRVEAVFRTREPCAMKVEEYRRQYTVAACVPTTFGDLENSRSQMQALATIYHDNTDRTSR